MNTDTKVEFYHNGDYTVGIPADSASLYINFYDMPEENIDAVVESMRLIVQEVFDCMPTHAHIIHPEPDI